MSSEARYIHGQTQHGTLRQRLDLALESELRSGETIMWRGIKMARVEPKGFAIYLFAIPWTAFALLWTSLAAWGTSSMGDASPLDWAFPLFGTPFIVIGLAMLATPFVPLLQRGRILFSVTDQRVIRLSMGSDLTVNSVPASRIGDIVRHEGGDGTGSIELSLTTPVVNFAGRQSKKFTLGRVDHVRDAYGAVLELSQKD
ncbi:MAG: hypothetical protein ABJN35_08550 [Erythrobacter sp.]